MKKNYQLGTHKRRLARVFIAACAIVLSGCTFHAPRDHAARPVPLPHHVTNVYILQETCNSYISCTWYKPPSVFVNGLELGSNIPCSVPETQRVDRRNYDYGAVCEISSRDSPLLIDVLVSAVPPRFIVDYELEVSEEPTFVWISLRGNEIIPVSREQACRGEHEDFKRPFPIPDICNE